MKKKNEQNTIRLIFEYNTLKKEFKKKIKVQDHLSQWTDFTLQRG